MMRLPNKKVFPLVLLAITLMGLPPAAFAQQGELVTTQILTPSYEFTTTGITVPEAAFNDVPGAPRLPIKGFTVQLPLSGDWTMTFESVNNQILSDLVDIPSTPVPNLNLNTPQNWASDLNSLPSAVPVLDQPDDSVYGVNAFYPASPVVAGDPQIQGGQRVLPIRVFPFQYNPVTRQVRHHPDIEITVSVTQSAAPSSPVVSEIVHGQAVPETTGKVLRIHTQEQGFYRLTYDDLLAKGVAVGPDGSNPNNFAMFYKGEPIDIQLTGAEDNRFNQGDLVAFYAEPYDLGRYQDYNVYYFLEDGTGYASPIMTRAVTSTFTPTVASTISQTLRVEKNIDYRSTYERPKRADHFFDTILYPNSSAPVDTRTYTLILDDPVTSAGSAHLSAVIHGGDNSNGVFNPDQSVRMRFNGQDVGLYQWEGSVDYAISEELSAASLLITSTVDLIAALDQLPGISLYWISPDWVELSYPALADAEDDSLFVEGVIGGGGDIVTTGFSTGDASVYDVRDPRSPVLLDGIAAQNTGFSYAVYWTDTEPQPTYFLTTDAAMFAPAAIEEDQPSNWRSPAHDFDYIAIIGTERSVTSTTTLGAELGNAIQPLLDHRSAEGLLVAKVGLQDIYDEFSNGFVDPEAIRDFLTYAYNNWQRQPRYVLLVGDGHYAFRDEVETDLHNLVPPYFVHVDPWVGEVPADSRFVSVDGEEDYLPEMAIGRIPANSVDEITAVVSKIITYENPALTPDGAWNQNAVYVADNYSDPAGNFHALSDDVRINWLPSAHTSERVYYRMDATHDTGAEMRTAIKAAFNQGALFLQWFGHGSTVRWGSVSMFNLFDPPALAVNQQTPLTMHNACWTGYFTLLANSNWQSLGETLLLTPGRGAIADYSPSGLHIGAALLTLDQGVHKAMFQDRLPRAGDVINASKYFYFDNSFAYHDLIDSMIFFGDPALKLRLPEGDLSTSSFEVSDATAGPDASLVYTATVRNSSIFTTTEPLITVDYPQQWVTVADANGAVDDGDSLSWTLPDLAAGGQNVVTFTLTTNSILPAGDYDLTVPAEISSNMAPTATLQVTTVTYAEPDLSTSALAVSRPWMGAGQAITVTALLENSGAADSPGSVMALTLPAGMGAPITLSPGLTYSPISHTVSWVGDLPVIAAQVLTFTASAESAPITCTTLAVSGEVVDVLAASTALSATVNLAVPDVDCSGAVNVVDIQLVAGRWGAILGQPEYLYEYDLNGNDAIDVIDITIAANHWN